MLCRIVQQAGILSLLTLEAVRYSTIEEIFAPNTYNSLPNQKNKNKKNSHTKYLSKLPVVSVDEKLLRYHHLPITDAYGAILLSKTGL